MACDGCVLGPGRVHADVVNIGPNQNTPRCRVQKLVATVQLPGRAAMIEAESLLQCEISCP